ncbi:MULTISPECIES: hypothetical protein [Bacteroidales]|nr:hypothetical protein [Bacteroides thetaiotaomicron]
MVCQKTSSQLPTGNWLLVKPNTTRTGTGGCVSSLTVVIPP